MVATLLGVAVTIGYGINQSADGAYIITEVSCLVQLDNKQSGLPMPSTSSLLVGLIIIMVISITP